MLFPRQLRLVLTTKSLRFVFLACVIEARKIIGPPFIAQNITASRAICAEPRDPMMIFARREPAASSLEGPPDVVTRIVDRGAHRPAIEPRCAGKIGRR